jgi:DNA primase
MKFKATAPTDWERWLADEVFPRLKPEEVYTHEAHRWQKSGPKWRGGCPWHESDSGTSFVVDSDTAARLWYCAGCQVGGSPVQYLHRLGGGVGSPKGPQFVQIARKLAALAGVLFPEREPSEEDVKREARRAILKTVALTCSARLQTPAGEQARAYLHSRGFTDEGLLDLGVGLHPALSELREAIRQAGHDLALAEEAGVLGGHLVGYITLPWGDEHGQPLTIYGTWPARQPPAGTPKKMALPNPKANKSDPNGWEATKRSPYLFDRARRAGHKHVTLVEGVTDAALAQARGDTSVVGCVAASLSRGQAETVRRCRVERVTIALDPDKAGENGIGSCIDSLTACDIPVYVAPQLPGGLDPDDFIGRDGIEAWRAHVAKARHGFRWKAERILGQHKPEPGWTDPGRDAAVAAAVEWAAGLPEHRDEELARHFVPPITLEVGGDPVELRARIKVRRQAQAHKGNGQPAAGPSATVGSVGRRKPYRPLAAYRPFPLHTLPPVLCDLVPAAAEAIGCDPGLIAGPALAVVAGCIGNARGVVLKRGWIEPAVVWSLTVADSGGHKSPAYRAAVQPLTDLQLDLFEQYQQRKKDHKKELEDYANLVQELKRKKQSIQNLIKPPPPEEPPVRITGDSTIEALGVLLGDNPRGLLFARDELDAWFQSFTRYKGGKGGGTDRPQWLELHAAGTLILHRLTREQRCLSVRRAAVSVTGTIQPAILAAALDRDALQAGLGARFLLTMPPRRRRVWTEKDIPEDVSGAYMRLLMDLLGLPLADTAKRKGYYLGLSEAARRLWVEFYNEWGNVQHDAEGEQAAAFAKIEAYGARLMLLHHVITETVTGGPRAPQGGGKLPPVTESSARAGIELARWYAAEALRIYAMLHDTQEERETRRLVDWVAAHEGQVTVRQLQNSNSRKWPSREDAEAALGGLVEAGLGRWEQAAAPQGGNPARWFVLIVPTSDTSDTCSPGGDPTDVAPGDTGSDTCAPAETRQDSIFRGKAWGSSSYGTQPGAADNQVSEVSDVGCGEANSRPGESRPASEKQVSDERGDAWEG